MSETVTIDSQASEVAPVQVAVAQSPIEAPVMAEKQEPVQPQPVEAKPVVQPQTAVAVMPIKLYAVTIGDDYPEDSIQYQQPEYRQIYYYQAQNAAQVQDRLMQDRPNLVNFTIDVA